MKTLVLLLTALCFLAACKKGSILQSKPDTKPNSSSATPPGHSNPKKAVDPPSHGNTAAVYDTIPDKAVLRLRLAKDSTNYDETAFLFNHTAGFDYDPAGDAPYVAGYGQESLASLSSDGHDLAISTIPFKAGTPIKLDVNAGASAPFVLKISYLKDIPADIQVIIRDKYLKDSANVRTGPYKFNIIKSDTATYGSNRFSVVFRNQTH
ncbi:MAG TPA: hypothetical protein VG367_01895 [Mucilaginibacter sp.]|jgi:hypothetical protein|nr:hypothetical protein [Mucilaginibacter sp.]